MTDESGATVGPHEIPDVQEIQAMPDDEFGELVAAQLNHNRRDERLWSSLASADLCHRTLEALDLMLMRANGVVKDKNRRIEEVVAAFGDTAEGREPRALATRSRNLSARYARMVSEAAMEVRQQIAKRKREARRERRVHAHAEPPVTELIQSNQELVRRAIPALRRLIEQVIAHEAEMSDDPSQADEELWGLLDEVSVSIGKERMTLRKAHEARWQNQEDRKKE